MRLGLLARVFVLFALSTIFLTPAFSEEFVSIDLKPYANAKITNTEWWTGNPGPSDLEELLEIAKNSHDFEGPGGEMVPFKVEDANLRIFGTNAAQNPEKIEEIKVEMTAKTAYFVHMTGWEAPGNPGYKFVMNYEDGSSEELLMQSHVNLDDWCHVPGQVPGRGALTDENSTWIWRESGVTCGSVGVIATKWENPHPDKRIKTMDFASLNTAAVPAVFAITLGGATAVVSPGGKLAMTWASLKADMEFR